MKVNRRNFIKYVGAGCVTLVFGPDESEGAEKMSENRSGFTFVQVSDTHWGFAVPRVNPDPKGTLPKAIAAINDMKPQPDFVVFTGDITHSTPDANERRRRMAEARKIIRGIKVKNIKFLAGEHDAGADQGKAFREYFGKTNYTFDHKGVHFIAIDNVSNSTSSIGEGQLKWLKRVLKKYRKDSHIVVLTHRPLFELYPQWDWWTSDGAKALELLKPFENVTVLYGHIHQEHHHTTGAIEHHAAMGMMYPLPAPGSVPQKAPVPWDPAHPYKGLGFRSVQVIMKKAPLKLIEYPIAAAEKTFEHIVEFITKNLKFFSKS
jgi:Icc-related predicted phosphoesterase